MSMNVLPNEILEQVFKNLNGKDVIKCREVSQRWKTVVGGLRDEFWKQICAKEYSDVYEDSYRKATLSWFGLYRSLNLWSQVEDTEAIVYKLSVKNTNRFQTLSNGIVACPQRTKDACPPWLYDSVVYYNLDTLKEHHREHFDFYFQNCAENEEVIVLQIYLTEEENLGLRHVLYKCSRLCVIVKKLQSCHFYLNVHDEAIVTWKLFPHGILYQTQYQLVHVKFVKKENDFILEKVILIDLFMLMFHIRDYAIHYKEIYILTWDYNVYTVKNKEMLLVCSNIDIDEHKSLDRLKMYGFDWTKPANIFGLLCMCHSKKYDFDAAYVSHKIMIKGNAVSHPKIHIYYNPYSITGELQFLESIPQKTIRLGTFKKPEKPATCIHQTDVVEMVDGHKIIVLCHSEIIVIDLIHKRAGMMIDEPFLCE